MSNLRKAFVFALTAALSMGLLTACGADAEKSGLDWINNPSSWEEYMNNAKIKSLTTLGNTYRLKNAIKKARSGEDVNVVYIGGSITEGEGLETSYANRSFNYFKDTFGKGKGENVHYFNSGISGTPSTLGALRFENDVLNHEPDIVFIEFAVNDGDDADTKSAFESMILDALNYKSKPAIILLFARMREGWTSQGWKKEIGEYYNLPMISYADGITYLLDEGAMSWDEFSSDYTHPHAEGNAVVADFISYFYDEVDRAEAPAEDVTIPAEPMNTLFYTGKRRARGSTIPTAGQRAIRTRTSRSCLNSRAGAPMWSIRPKTPRITACWSRTYTSTASSSRQRNSTSTSRTAGAAHTSATFTARITRGSTESNSPPKSRTSSAASKSSPWRITDIFHKNSPSFLSEGDYFV